MLTSVENLPVFLAMIGRAETGAWKPILLDMTGDVASLLYRALWGYG